MTGSKTRKTNMPGTPMQLAFGAGRRIMNWGVSRGRRFSSDDVQSQCSVISAESRPEAIPDATKHPVLPPDLELQGEERWMQSISADKPSRDGYFSVFQGQNKYLRPVIIKALLPDCAGDIVLQECLRFMITAMNQLGSSPGVIRLYGYIHTAGGGICAIFESYDGLLSEWMADRPYCERRTLIIQIAEALRGLHNAGRIHGDIRVSNIFMLDGRPLLGTVGCHQVLETMKDCSQRTLSMRDDRWLSIEQIFGWGESTSSSDIWSFAMTVLEILTDQKPFHQIRANVQVVIQLGRLYSENEGIEQVLERPTQEDAVSRGMTSDVWQLLVKCWKFNARERPSIHEVIERLTEAWA